jgi:hypothetical protein
MDKISKYQQVIISFLNEYAAIRYANAPNIEQQVMSDFVHNHFQLMSIGWHKNQFVHEVVFHFDIKDEKIWIQQNWTDIKLRQELIQRGVAMSDIVIGFLPENNKVIASEYTIS